MFSEINRQDLIQQFHVLLIMLHKLSIIYRFPLFQALNSALNISRVSLMDTFRNINRSLYNKYKRYWKLILNIFEDINAVSYRKLKLFKYWQTSKDVVEYLLNFDAKLQYNYEILNKLRHSLKHNNSTVFITIFNEIDPNKVCFTLRVVLKFLKKYQLYINNTLNYPNIINV